MKYPGLPAAGSGPAGSGWALAGSDLSAATELLEEPAGPAARVQYAEVLRRRFEPGVALRALGRGDGAEHTVDELLCLGNIHWTVGDAARATPYFAAARRRARADRDPAAELAAALGQARAARVRYQRRSQRRLGVAVRLAHHVDDVHLLADLDRERAAWALLRGDPGTALTLARRAGDVHREAGDGYLLALAETLVARALNARQDGAAAVDLVRAQIAAGQRIGSWDVEQISMIYLGQFLQRGAAPDTPQWTESERMLTTVLRRATDPFTLAEAVIGLAHLHTMSGEFDLAERELEEYGRLYVGLGGNQVSTGNLLKARARLEVARHGGESLRDLRRSPQAAAGIAAALMDLRRAGRAYRRAGFGPGRESVREHIRTVLAITGGRRPWWRGRRLRTADPLGGAQHHLATGAAARARGRLPQAAAAYGAAERAATAAGATVLAAVAAEGQAEVAFDRGDRSRALTALRAGVAHAESIRAALVGDVGRTTIARSLTAHYERALLLAARLDDGDLAVELVERLRTERLAGLLRRRHTPLPPDVAELLERLDEVNAALLAQEPDAPAGGTVRSVRHLAAAETPDLLRRRADLHARLAERTTALFADTFGAEPVRRHDLDDLVDDLLALVPLRGHDEQDVVVSVWRSGTTGEVAVQVTGTTDELSALREVLTATGAGAGETRRRLRAPDLEPVRGLLPQPFRDRLLGATDPVRLVVVPTGWLWAVPFAAVPVDATAERLLVDHTSIVLAPSVRFSTALQRRDARAPGPPAAVSWVDTTAEFTAPEVDHLDAHPGGHTRLTDPAALRDAVVAGGDRWRTAVIAAHGNREPGLAQAVVAGRRSVLTAADFLDGRADPPAFVSFASCHSGYPDTDDPHEPLGLALAALAAGATQVLSAHFEIGGPTSGRLGRLYRRLGHVLDVADVPAVLAEVLRDPARRDRTLWTWAALAVVGTHPRPRP